MKRRLKVRIWDGTQMHVLKINHQISKPRNYHVMKDLIEIPQVGFTYITYKEIDKWAAGIIDTKEQFWNIRLV